MSANKISNYKQFSDNYDKIDWTKRVKKKFKTSWGAEYTLEIKEKLPKKRQHSNHRGLNKENK